MENTVSIGIYRAKNKTEYSGNVTIYFGTITRVNYNLINKKEPGDFFKGEFDGNYKNMASVIKKLTQIVNT